MTLGKFRVILFLLFASFLKASIYAQQRFIKVDNSKTWINTIGLEDRKAGQPIVVFESGRGTPMDNWDKVLEGISKLAPIVTYDRPGIGESDPIDEMPTIKKVSDRLVRILNHLELEPPYLCLEKSFCALDE